MLVDDILYCVLDLLHSYWECSEFQNINSDLVSHQACRAGSCKRAVCLWPSSLPGVSLSSPLSCLSLKLTPARCALLGPATPCFIVSEVWSSSPTRDLPPFFPSVSWVTPEVFTWEHPVSPQLVVAQWPESRATVSIDIDTAGPALNPTIYL